MVCDYIILKPGCVKVPEEIKWCNAPGMVNAVLHHPRKMFLMIWTFISFGHFLKYGSCYTHLFLSCNIVVVVRKSPQKAWSATEVCPISACLPARRSVANSLWLQRDIYTAVSTVTLQVLRGSVRSRQPLLVMLSGPKNWTNSPITGTYFKKIWVRLVFREYITKTSVWAVEAPTMLTKGIRVILL